jgi:hypothetical protein
MLRSIVICVPLLLAGLALADPAAIPDAGDGGVQRAFEQFARDWMDKVHALEQQSRSKPAVKVGAQDPVYTYRGYGDDYSIELRPTGRPSAPYVGLLRYTERLYSCESARAQKCTVASSVPVTEIFRFKNGRWAY